MALDGRIEAGDMILQVNDISFENFTNDQAVDVLRSPSSTRSPCRDAVARKGPIKLTVAKCFENGPRSCFAVPRQRDEPVRPIDPHAWIQHTNAMRGMPSILEGSEGAPTPLPGEFTHGRPPSSSTVTSGSGGGPNTVVGGHLNLDVHTDKKKVRRKRKRLVSDCGGNGDAELGSRHQKSDVAQDSDPDVLPRSAPSPSQVSGSDLVDWLLEHVSGLRERKDGRRFAADLLKAKLIAHVVNKVTFTEQCYYVLGEECAGLCSRPLRKISELARLRGLPEAATTGGGWRFQNNAQNTAPSMVRENGDSMRLYVMDI